MSVDESGFASTTSSLPSTAGQRLAAARDAAGLTVADLAAKTRIAARHLTALEKEDFASLPGRTYVLGFTRTFAKAVGLDPNEMVNLMGRDYSRAAPAPEEPPVAVFAPGDPARVPSSRFAWMAAFVLLLVAVAGFVWWQNNSSPVDGLPSLLPEETPSAAPSQMPSEEASAAPSDAASDAAQPAGPVVLTAMMDKLWIKVSDASGKQLAQKVLALGETYTVPEEADGPTIWTGRPDRLSITIGGQDVPPISNLPEIVKNVPISAKALLARGQAGAAAPASNPAASPIPGVTPGMASGTMGAPVASPSPAAFRRPLRHVPRPRPTSAGDGVEVAPASPSTVTP